METQINQEVDLRKKIIEINSNPELDQVEKSRLIFELLNSENSFDQFIIEKANNDEKESQEEIQHDRHNEPSISYHNKDERILGCSHYPRQANIRASCCGKFYTCRICHDEEEQHKINRYEIREMRCMHCSTIQKIGQFCSNQKCKKRLGKYYCDICHLLTDANKDIFHCKFCNICRVGKESDYKHCLKCGVCINTCILETHTCIENSIRNNCPICIEPMFTSIKPVTPLVCGHYMHLHCLQDYLESNYRCPICSKSLKEDMSEYWNRIDEYMIENQMPEEFKDKTSNIICNDCGKHSKVPYHFIYHKCSNKNCGSYNTTIS